MSRSAVGRAFALVCSFIAAPALVPAAQPAQRTAQPQANYMLNCMGCHIADGSGAPGKVPSVRDSLVRLASSAAGRRYLVQVPGASQSPLSNLQLAQVLSWMVRNLSARPVPRGFVDFTADEVAGYRKTRLVSVRDARTRLLGNTRDNP
jgi:mono/diheme cytochrome c family protein